MAKVLELGAKTNSLGSKKASFQQKLTPFEAEMFANLQKERRFYEEMVGIADDRTVVDIDDLKKQIWRAES